MNDPLTAAFFARFMNVLKFVGQTLAVHTVFGLGLGIVTFYLFRGMGYPLAQIMGWSKEFTILTLAIPWISACRLVVALYDFWDRSMFGLKWKLRQLALLQKERLITEREEAAFRAKLLNWYNSQTPNLPGPTPPRDVPLPQR